MNELTGILSATLSLGSPLVIAASGEVVLEKSGILNIGLEGMMLTSAFCAFYICHLTGNPYAGLLTGIACGVLLAIISALLVLFMDSDQVVVGTGINLLALGVTGSFFVSAFGKTGQLISVETFPKFGGVLSLNLLMVFAILAPILSWYLLWKTKWGLVVRGTGESPHAIEMTGYSVIRTRLQTYLYAGFLAGIAGSYLTLAQTNTFAENMTAGRGFVVIAAVTFGGWSMLGAVFACTLIAFAFGLQFQLKGTLPQIPYQLFDMLPYLLALSVLAGAGRGRNAPASLALPFRKLPT